MLVKENNFVSPVKLFFCMVVTSHVYEAGTT